MFSRKDPRAWVVLVGGFRGSFPTVGAPRAGGEPVMHLWCDRVCEGKTSVNLGKPVHTSAPSPARTSRQRCHDLTPDSLRGRGAPNSGLTQAYSVPSPGQTVPPSRHFAHRRAHPRTNAHSHALTRMEAHSRASARISAHKGAQTTRGAAARGRFEGAPWVRPRSRGQAVAPS